MKTMKTAKKTTAFIVAAFMVLMMFPATVLTADPGAPVNDGCAREVRDGITTYNVRYNEAGMVNYVVLQYGVAQPSYTQVKHHQDASGDSVPLLYCGTVECAATTVPTIFTAVLPIDLSALAPDKYNIFCVCTDVDGNTSDVKWIDIDGMQYSFEIMAQLAFTVNDGTAPISGATVKVGSETKTTGADGKTVFTLSGGVYTYLVQASGYQGVSGSYIADKQTDAKTVSLAPGVGGEYSAVLNIKDDKDTNLKNAKVIIGGVTKTADAGGNVEFFLTPGEYAYTASAMGRITKSGSFAISDANYTGSIVLATDPAGVDLVINSHQKGKLGAEIDAILSANCLGAGAVRSLAVNGGGMDGTDFSEYHGIGKLSGYTNNIFASVDLSGTTLDGNTLPGDAFYYFTHLTSITLPNTVAEIGSRAFAHCPLTSFTFPASVQVIGDSVFAYCSALKTVTFPAGVTSVGGNLFSNWGSGRAPVTDVYMLSTNPAAVDVAGSSFYNQSNAVLHVPEGSAAAYANDARDGSTTDGKWFGLYIYDPDAAPPVIKGLVAGRWWDGESVFFAFSSDSPGQYYYALVDDGAPAPAIDTSGTGTALDGGLEGFSTFEEPETAKDIYIVLKGVSGKLSNILKMDMPVADAAPADITITGHTEGKIADEINAELTKVNLSYNYSKVGGLTVNGGTIGSDDAEFIYEEVYYLTHVDFSGTSFEDNTVPEDFFDWSDTLMTIVLPASVEAIGDGAFWELEALESITLGSSVPPAVGEGVFETVPDGAVVYVPSGSKGAYLAVDDGNTTDGKWYGLTVVEIGATPVSATINPASVAFDKNPAKRADVSTTITWNDAESVTDIKAGGTSIGAGNYSVNENTLTIRKEYLATKAVGGLVLTVEFGGCGAATLTITIGNSAADTGSGSGAYSNRTLTDAATGVTVSGNSIDNLAQLIVKTINAQSLPAQMREAIASGKMIVGYDIALTGGGFTGELALSFPVGAAYNGRTVTILHHLNGWLKTYTATVVNGKATVTVTSLSPFAVTDRLIPDSMGTTPPQTGDAATPLGFIMLGVAALCAGWLIVRRRRA